MRRLHLLLTLPSLFAADAVLAQAPPTRVERAAADDPQTGELPPTASWRGTPIENRPYGETPEIEEAHESIDPPAGTYDADLPPAEFRTDGDAFPDFERVDRATAAAPPPLPPGDTVALDAYPDELSYTYAPSGEIVALDRYRPGAAEPYQTLNYEYTTTGTVVEREVMPDGSQRFVREVGLDVFQASQGPGNQPYRDNRDDSQGYPVENAARPTPSTPHLGTDTDVSPQR